MSEKNTQKSTPHLTSDKCTKYNKLIKRFIEKTTCTVMTPLSQLEFDEYGLSYKRLICGCRRPKDWLFFKINFPLDFRPIKTPHRSLICDNNKCAEQAFIHQSIPKLLKKKKLCLSCSSKEIFGVCDDEAVREIRRRQILAHGLPADKLLAPK